VRRYAGETQRLFVLALLKRQLYTRSNWFCVSESRPGSSVAACGQAGATACDRELMMAPAGTATMFVLSEPGGGSSKDGLGSSLRVWQVQMPTEGCPC
jgi:hypothetical protein